MFPFASAEWVFRTDYRTVFVYLSEARREIAIRDEIRRHRWGIEPRPRQDAHEIEGAEGIESFGRLGRVVRE